MHVSGQFIRQRRRERSWAGDGNADECLLRLTADPRGEAAAEVAASLDRLAALPIQENGRESIRNLTAHGRLIIATLPAVE